MTYVNVILGIMLLASFFANVILFFSFSVAFVSACFSSFYSIKLGQVILVTEESIEDCLDILDERYASLSKILEKPLFYDSQEVRAAVEELKTSKDAILCVANKLIENFGLGNVEGEIEEK